MLSERDIVNVLRKDKKINDVKVICSAIDLRKERAIALTCTCMIAEKESVRLDYVMILCNTTYSLKREHAMWLRIIAGSAWILNLEFVSNFKRRI